MSAKPSTRKLAGLPCRRTIRRVEAEAFLGGEQVVSDAIAEGLLKPCCHPPGKRQTFFRFADVVAVESDLLEGRYPGTPDPRANQSTPRHKREAKKDGRAVA